MTGFHRQSYATRCCGEGRNELLSPRSFLTRRTHDRVEVGSPWKHLEGVAVQQGCPELQEADVAAHAVPGAQDSCGGLDGCTALGRKDRQAKVEGSHGTCRGAGCGWERDGSKVPCGFVPGLWGEWQSRSKQPEDQDFKWQKTSTSNPKLCLVNEENNHHKSGAKLINQEDHSP